MIKILQRLLFLSFVLLFTVRANGCSTAHINQYAKAGDDITAVLQELVKQKKKIIIDSGTWYMSGTVILPRGVKIIGESQERSVIKIREDALLNQKFHFLFSTVELNVKGLRHDAWRHLKEEKYDHSIRNIEIRNLTFDLNRHPKSLLKKGTNAKAIKLGVAWLENCKNSSLNNCKIVDYLTYDESELSCNRNAVVTMIDCVDCRIENCESMNCTFLYVIYGRNILIQKNKGENSFGTWIETIGGANFRICDNQLHNVMCEVSSIGINTLKCEIANNKVIIDKGKAGSCLTLGHPTSDFIKNRGADCSANGAFVHNNIFTTTGTRGLIVQNANNVRIESNIIECVPIGNHISYAAVTFNAYYFSNEVVKGNTLIIKGGKGFGVGAMRTDGLIVESNKIYCNGSTALYVKDRNARNVNFIDNDVYDADVLLKSTNIQNISISQNRFDGGMLDLQVDSLSFTNNQWKNIPHNAVTLKGSSHDNLNYVSIVGNDFSTEKIIEDLFVIPVLSNRQSIDFRMKNNKIKAEKIQNIGRVRVIKSNK